MNSSVMRASIPWWLSVLVCVGAVGCQDAGASVPPPDVPSGPLSETMQIAWESRPWSIYETGNFPILASAFAQVFQDAANLDISFDNTDVNLPAPTTPPCQSPTAPDWPDLSFGSFYFCYAAAHRNTADPYGVFFVNHMSDNDTLTCHSISSTGIDPSNQWGVSFSATPTDNAVGSDRTQRFSFIPFTDIQVLVQTRCNKGQEAVEYAAIHLLAHEYGHQRAGLTDNISGNQTYHQGSVPTQRIDVMTVPSTDEELLTYPYPVFDRFNSDATCQQHTCQGNINCNRTVQ